MTRDSQVSEFLRKAKEAEKQEEKATNRDERWAWEKIAVSYLELAELERKKS